MLFLLFTVLLLSHTVAQTTDSNESTESTSRRTTTTDSNESNESTSRPSTTTGSNDSNESTSRPSTNSSVPTARNLQNATNNTIDNLNEMIADSQNERNTALFRTAITSLRKVQRLDYDRETLQQLTENIRRLNAANNLYGRSDCAEDTDFDDDIDSLNDDLNDDDIDDDSNADDDDDNDRTASNNVDRVKRILDAASEILEDYCD